MMCRYEVYTSRGIENILGGGWSIQSSDVVAGKVTRAHNLLKITTMGE